MDINVTELKERIDKGDDIVLIDVRETYEHEEFNIGGTLVPLGTIMTALPDLEDHKEKEVIVYCRSGQRSGMAKQLLQQAGFANVRNTIGGMMAWQKEIGS